MDNSILNDIKKLLGIDRDYEEFDVDVIFLINSNLSTLHQLGLGVNHFVVTGKDNTWDEFIPDNKYIEIAKEYIFIRVKLIFDPPKNSFTQNMYKSRVKELEWRIVQIMEEEDE